MPDHLSCRPTCMDEHRPRHRPWSEPAGYKLPSTHPALTPTPQDEEDEKLEQNFSTLTLDWLMGLGGQGGFLLLRRRVSSRPFSVTYLCTTFKGYQGQMHYSTLHGGTRSGVGPEEGQGGAAVRLSEEGRAWGRKSSG